MCGSLCKAPEDKKRNIKYAIILYHTFNKALRRLYTYNTYIRHVENFATRKQRESNTCGCANTESRTLHTRTFANFRECERSLFKKLSRAFVGSLSWICWNIPSFFLFHFLGKVFFISFAYSTP